MELAGIMIGLRDLTTAANRCQESMKLIYGELCVEGVDGSRRGPKVQREVRVVQRWMWYYCYMVKCQIEGV